MIKKIKWKDHNILGNLELDFTKEDGTIYNTIVIAGENGTGKTTILEELAKFFNFGPISNFDYIKYELNENQYTIINDVEKASGGSYIRKKDDDSSTTIVYDYMGSIENDIEDLRYYGFAYSKARSGFSTQKVFSIGLSQLDSDKYEMDSSNDFTFIKQLIVDIDAQDKSEWI